MNQLIAASLSFMLIPILIKKRVKLGYTILITATVLGLVSGIGGEAFVGSVRKVFLTSSSMNTILVVTMVSILGGTMKQYGVLNVIVDTMQQVIGSKRNIITIIPAMVGLLVIPGGAILSAPFVKQIGEEIHLSPPRQAVINLVFRHLAMFLLPFSTSIIIIPTVLPEVSIPFVIALNGVFVMGIIALGYLLFLRDIQLEKSKAKNRNKENIIKLALYTSPIYACVIVTGVTGIPFYLSMLVSLLIVYFLGNKQDFLRTAFQSIDRNIVITVTAVLIMQNVIMEMSDMLAVFHGIFEQMNHMASIMLLILFTSTFFGFISGYKVAALAITLPLIAQLDVSHAMMHVYIYIASGCAFIGYFFSPLHLCQAFTVEIMNVSTLDLYKEYKVFAPLLVLFLMVSALLFGLALT